jgi:hypothetical protein
MSVDLTKIQRDLSDLATTGTEGLAILMYGSFADRNPGLGPMRTCPHCHQRRRMFGTEPCCNASHAHTKRAYNPLHDVRGVRENTGQKENDTTERGFGPSTRHELGFYQEECSPRISDFSMAKLAKRLKHKQRFAPNYGRQNRWLMHDLTLELQNEAARNTTQLLLEGLLPFHEPVKLIGMADVPAFAERVILNIQRHKRHVKRDQQKLSRRINWGLVAGQDGGMR